MIARIRGRFVGTVAVLVAAVAPSPAVGDGFGAPAAVSTVGWSAESTATAVGQTGAAAVAWSELRITNGVFRYAIRARIGPSTANLGSTRLVARSRHPADPAVAVTDANTTWVCWGTDAPSSGLPDHTVVKCGVGPAGHALHVFTIAQAAGFAHVIGLAPDRSNHMVAVLSRPTPRGEYFHLFSLLMPLSGSHVAALHTITARANSSALPPAVATAADGSIGVSWTPAAGRGAGLAILAPGARQFSAPTLPSSWSSSYGVTIFGGASLGTTLPKLTSGPAATTADFFDTASLLTPQGWSDEIPIDPSSTWRTDDAALLSTGPATAVAAWTRSQRYNDACGSLRSSTVQTSTLTPGEPRPTARRPLSNPGALAIEPQLTPLSEGRSLLVWLNVLNRAGDATIAYAEGDALGTFTAPRTLPIRDAGSARPMIASSGSSALAAWITPSDTPRVEISSLRSAPPYATSGPTSKRPKAPC